MSETIGRRLMHMETMTLARVTLRQGAVVPMHEHDKRADAPTPP